MTANGMGYFTMLSKQEQAAAIHRLARSGMSDHSIAAVTGLAADMIRRILAEPIAQPPGGVEP